MFVSLLLEAFVDQVKLTCQSLERYLTAPAWRGSSVSRSSMLGATFVLADISVI
jgi:hypothetical protein